MTESQPVEKKVDHVASTPTPPTSPSPTTPPHLSRPRLLLIVVLCTVLAGGFLVSNLLNPQQQPFLPFPASPFTPKPTAAKSFSWARFQTDAEFQAYISTHRDQGISSLGMGFGAMERGVLSPPNQLMAPDVIPTTGGSQPSRYSQTNVQVTGIDEPDIVKTNGRQLFLSTESWWWAPLPRPVPFLDQPVSNGAVSLEQRIAPEVSGSAIYPPVQPGETQVIQAFPIAELARQAKIEVAGQLLLADQTLIILGQQQSQAVLTGYDVSTPAQPVQRWQVRLAEQGQVVTARLKENRLYVLTQQSLFNGPACPFIPLTESTGRQLAIPCTEIYYPTAPVSQVDTTYTALVLDPSSGAIQRSKSFVGSLDSGVVYMSPQALYVTYRSQPDMVEFFYQFVTNQGSELFPAEFKEKLSRLRGYELSPQAKQVELQQLLSSHQQGQNADDRLRLQNELQNRMQDFLRQRRRELEDTLIVKLASDTLETQATGRVPGTVLNQFSLDEYQGKLRVATTFGQTWTQFGQPESASDVYVLDNNLRQQGVVTDLGQSERIYAVRFLGETGYVVTYRQVDPFYVLDLRDPSQPRKAGELKIPGYSSYLHPLSTGLILGVGKENDRVKLSLFNVSDPQQPREASKYLLDEYWSEVLNTHHAFLHDPDKGIFFLPGSQGGYVFRYQNSQLELVKAIRQDQTQRAIFINDYLYVISPNQVTVLDQRTWQVSRTLSW